MNQKVIESSLREVVHKTEHISSQIESIRKTIRIKNEKLQKIENNINEENIEYEKCIKEINLINDEKVHLSKHTNAMKANVECLKSSFEQINEMITSLTTETEDKRFQLMLQIEEFDKIKDEYNYKMESLRDCYESTSSGVVYRNRRMRLFEINKEMQSIESQLKQLQADSFKQKCENSRLNKGMQEFVDPIRVIQEIAVIKLESEWIKTQINFQIESQKLQTNNQIKTQRIQDLEQKQIIEVKENTHKESIITSNVPQMRANDENKVESVPQSVPQKPQSSSLFNFQLLSPTKTTKTNVSSNVSEFSFGNQFSKASPSGDHKNDFGNNSFFGNFSPQTNSANNTQNDFLFGNFGQNSSANDSPFNFNFGNTSNESNSSNSPLMWK